MISLIVEIDGVTYKVQLYKNEIFYIAFLTGAKEAWKKWKKVRLVQKQKELRKKLIESKVIVQTPEGLMLNDSLKTLLPTATPGVSLKETFADELVSAPHASSSPKT